MDNLIRLDMGSVPVITLESLQAIEVESLTLSSCGDDRGLRATELIGETPTSFVDASR
jgi:hypothetical protein